MGAFSISHPPPPDSQNLLARELQLDNVLRLWDTYFAEPDGLSLHVCVCLGESIEGWGGVERASASICLYPHIRIHTQARHPSIATAAILEKCKEDLEELEQQELNQYLFNLPEFDMTEVRVEGLAALHVNLRVFLTFTTTVSAPRSLSTPAPSGT